MTLTYESDLDNVKVNQHASCQIPEIVGRPVKATFHYAIQVADACLIHNGVDECSQRIIRTFLLDTSALSALQVL